MTHSFVPPSSRNPKHPGLCALLVPALKPIKLSNWPASPRGLGANVPKRKPNKTTSLTQTPPCPFTCPPISTSARRVRSIQPPRLALGQADQNPTFPPKAKGDCWAFPASSPPHCTTPSGEGGARTRRPQTGQSEPSRPRQPSQSMPSEAVSEQPDGERTRSGQKKMKTILTKLTTPPSASSIRGIGHTHAHRTPLTPFEDEYDGRMRAALAVTVPPSLWLASERREPEAADAKPALIDKWRPAGPLPQIGARGFTDDQPQADAVTPRPN